MNLVSRFFAVLAALLTSGAGMAVAQEKASTLHVVIVGDVNNSSIGPSVKKDVASFKSYFTANQYLIGMVQEISVLNEVNWGRSAVKEKLNGLEVGPEDAVVFYFAGHGFRTAEVRTQWPSLVLEGDEGLDLAAIYQILWKKNPRLLIVLADCCNNLVPVDYYPMAFFAGDTEANLKKLWVQSRGGYMASGSSPGEFAYGTEAGGLFSIQFRKTLEASVAGEEPPTWEGIFKTATREIVRNRTRQQPQFAENPVFGE